MRSRVIPGAGRPAARSFWLAGALALILGASPGRDASAALVFTLDTTFNGSAPTSAGPGWLTVTFANAGVDAVTLTMQANLSVASEFIDEVAFNVDPAITPSSLTFTQTPAAPPAGTVTAGAQNVQSLIGGGSAGTGFDVKIGFATSGGPGPGNARFDGNDLVTFLITGSGLAESSFDFTNTGSALANVAAHVQGIPPNTSGAIQNSGTSPGPTAVPEPASIAIVLPGLAALALARRRARRAAPPA